MKHKLKLLMLLTASGLIRSDFFAQETQTSPPAQTTGDGQNKPGQPVMRLYDVPPAPEVPTQAPEEVADYFKVTQTQDAGQRVQLIEDFLKKYPASKHVPTLHQVAVSSYQQLNNYEKMVEHGEQTLLSFPSSPAVLSVLALAYTSHGESDKAIDRASKAVAILDKLTKPANADATRWKLERDQYLAMNYASLGGSFISKYEATRQSQRQVKAAPSAPETPAAPAASALDEQTPTVQRGQATLDPQNEASVHLAKALDYLGKAVEFDPRYEFAQFQLGIVFAYKNEVAKAVEAFAKTVALEGAFASMARQNLEAIYKSAHKNSLDGLDQVIAKAKDDLAQKKSPPP
jgi:tetratricopeptide (TPR) repeat protein